MPRLTYTRTLPQEGLFEELQGILDLPVHFYRGCVSAEVSPYLYVVSDLAALQNEWLHYDSLVIMNIPQGLADFIPREVAFSRDFSVAFTDVQMPEMSTGKTYCVPDIVFFNVHVKGVQENLGPLASNGFTVAHRLFAGIEDICFESIYYLEA